MSHVAERVHLPESSRKRPWGLGKSRQLHRILGIGRTLKGVSKDRSGARSEKEKGGHGQFRRDNVGKPGGDWDV